MDWKHGYYADAGYTYGWYAETMPLRLRWAALIQGHLVPKSSFRYLDAGCGQGVSLVLAAAGHPESEFVGIDFLPEHIAHARSLAAACNLKNITFIEADFLDIQNNVNILGEFDYAVCHGISTWIDPNVKKALFHFVGKCLKPGGLFYNSYNTMPGWFPVSPFQHLVRLEQRSRPGATALQCARQSMSRLADNGAALFGAMPSLQARLHGMDSQDKAYLVQEYNNKYWAPVFVSDMIELLGTYKLSYLGTATLPEAFDGLLPSGLGSLISEHSDITMREQLRDFALNQGFRRDLYIKGRNPPWKGEYRKLLEEEQFVLNPLCSRPGEGEPYKISVAGLELKGDGVFYSWLLEQMSDGGCSVGEMAQRQPNLGLRNAIPQALSILLHGGWVMCLNKNDPSSAQATNKAILDCRIKGAPYSYISIPFSGSACSISDIDALLLAAYIAGVSEKGWVEYVLNGMNSLGKALSVNGRVVTDPREGKVVLANVTNGFDYKLGFFKTMGAVQ